MVRYRTLLAWFINWVCGAHICKGKLSYSVKLFLSKIHSEVRMNDLVSAYMVFFCFKRIGEGGKVH